MGYDGERGHPVLFDLETIAHERAREFLPPPDVEYLTPPKNYTKPDTIEKWKGEEKARRIKAWEDELDRCALDPDLCRIVALGYMAPLDDEPVVLTCESEAAEIDALATFWDFARYAQLLGFNCAGFDVPVLLRRSLLLGVKAPNVSISKYRHPSVTDLMKLLSFDGAIPWRKQSFYIRRFGLDVPADDITGADIAQLVNDGKWDAVRHHCRCDVLGVKALAQHIGVIRAPQPAAVL